MNSERKLLSWLIIVLLVFLAVPVILVAVGVGMYLWAAGPGYYADAREVERVAAKIPGVEVLEVKGHDDITYEDLWLDIRYRGIPVYFQVVTTASFNRWTEHMGVGWLGDWNVTQLTYDSVADEAAGSWCVLSPCVDFGPEGELADRFDPPFGGIRDFLDRIDEAKALIDEIPTGAPGIRIVTQDGRIHHIMKRPRE